MILANLASLLPTDTSALESSISALESSISALESPMAAIDGSLAFWELVGFASAGLVVIGVLLELNDILHRHDEEKIAWALSFFGVVRLLERPRFWKKYRVELASVILVAGGVAGELGAGLMIESNNTALRAIDIQLRSKNAELRSDSDQLLALVTQKAKDEQSARVKLEATVAWRRLSKEQQLGMTERLSNFPGVRVGISYLSGVPDAPEFADDINAALHAANLRLYSLEPFSLFGGYGGRVYPLHPSTGVNISEVTNRGREAASAIQSELCSIGFDATLTGKPEALSVTVPKPTIDLEVLVVARPVTEQGRKQLKIDTKTRDCKASE